MQVSCSRVGWRIRQTLQLESTEVEQVVELTGREWRPHEVSIDDQRQPPVRPMVRAEAAMLSAPEPEVEAGTSRVRVTVSGTAWGR